MIEATLYGDAEIVRKLDALPNRLRDELKIGIGRAALKLARSVQENKLSGQVLKVRTGRLRRSIASAVTEDGTSVSGIVSTPVVYAPFQEYGFSGDETVREHLRRSKAQFSLRKLTKSGRETAASARKAAGSGEITVRAHTRHVEYPAHSFLRTALRELEAQGVPLEEINGAIARALA